MNTTPEALAEYVQLLPPTRLSLLSLIHSFTHPFIHSAAGLYQGLGKAQEIQW